VKIHSIIEKNESATASMLYYERLSSQIRAIFGRSGVDERAFCRIHEQDLGR
jgi:hypothetical protein